MPDDDALLVRLSSFPHPFEQVFSRRRERLKPYRMTVPQSSEANGSRKSSCVIAAKVGL